MYGVCVGHLQLRHGMMLCSLPYGKPCVDNRTTAAVAQLLP